MEAIAFSDQVHNNKENIPPFLSANAKLSKNPVPESGSSTKKCKKTIRLKRKPLADITNLYQSRLPLPLPSGTLQPLADITNLYQSRLPLPLPSGTLRPSSSVSVPAALYSRKRKANSHENENETSSNSKSLRMGFR